MIFKTRNILLSIGIFFFIFFYWVQPTKAMEACTLDEVYEACGQSAGFLCVTGVPTPTPVVAAWYKVKTPNFITQDLGGFDIPLTNRLSFNAGDSDDDNSPYFIIGDGGANPQIDTGVIYVDTIDPGLEGKVSEKGWIIEGYNRKKELTPSKFYDYVKVRKSNVTITNLSQIQTSKVNIITPSGALVINDAETNNTPANMEKTPYVLVVDGDMTLQSDLNADSSDAIAVVVTGTLTISATVNNANAIFYVNNLVLSESTGDEDGLKIKGNLIVDGTTTNARTRLDNRRAALFVVFDPQMYYDLLPYFSIDTYDWKQIN